MGDDWRPIEREHVLKTLPAYFDAVERGDKPFEVRKDDRGFQRGDVLRLIRFDQNGDYFYRRAWPKGAEEVRVRVTWILTGGQFGVEPGYVVMGIAPLPAPPKEGT